MPQKYKKSFIVAEQRVFYRIKVTGVYEARYKRKAEGIKIEVSALTLEELKLKFIQALHEQRLLNARKRPKIRCL